MDSVEYQLDGAGWEVAELGRELDAIKDDILAKRGASDAAYIRRVIKIQRGLELSGRAALAFSSDWTSSSLVCPKRT